MSSGTYSLFLGDLSVFCTREDLVQLMAPFGYITDIRIKQDMTTGKKLSYGFVEFDNIDSAVNVINALDGYVLCGRPLRIRWGANKTVKKPNEGGKRAPIIPDTAPIHVSYCVASHNAVVTEESLRYIFSNFGYVLDATIKKAVCNTHRGSNEGYGFVHYPNTPQGVESAVCAVAGMNNVTMGGVHYRVCLSINLERQLNDTMNQEPHFAMMPPQMAPHMAVPAPRMMAPAPAPVPVYQFAPIRQQSSMPQQYPSNEYYFHQGQQQLLPPPPQQQQQQQFYYQAAPAPMAVPAPAPRYVMPVQQHQQQMQPVTPVYHFNPRPQQQQQYQQQQQQHYSQGQANAHYRQQVAAAATAVSDSSYSSRSEEEEEAAAARQRSAAVVTPESDRATPLKEVEEVVKEVKAPSPVPAPAKILSTLSKSTSSSNLKFLPVVCPCCSAHSGTVFDEELDGMAAKLNRARLDCGAEYKHSTIDVYMDVMESDDPIGSIGDY